MPNPFSKKGARPATAAEQVSDSQLTCLACLGVTSTGWYLPDEKVLYWDCECGEHNKVRIDLSV